MNQVAAIFLFILVNAASYLAILLIPNFAIILHLYPVLSEALERQQMQNWLFAGSFYVLIAGFLLSIGWFFSKGRKRVLLLLAPLYTTILYAVGVLAYFNMADAVPAP